MRCAEAGEFISALFDCETIPRSAAQHIGGCEACQGRLKSYVEMGVELRRIASLELPVDAKLVSWDRPKRGLTNWWDRGMGMMRIPRIAFASLVAGVLVLASGLVVVGVHARGKETVVMLKITPSGGPANSCPLSTVDEKWNLCASLGTVNARVLAYRVKILSKDGDRVLLGVQSKVYADILGSYRLSSPGDPSDALYGVPERQYWFEPGETLQVDMEGGGPVTLTGEWMDHVPVMVGGTNNLDPGPKELRIVSPMLVRGKEVAGDLEGGMASADQDGMGVVVYFPGPGRIVVSLSPFAGAVPGYVKLGRVSFKSNGQDYELLTGAPITRGDKVWVLHEPHYTPQADAAGYAFITSMNWEQIKASGSGKP